MTVCQFSCAMNSLLPLLADAAEPAIWWVVMIARWLRGGMTPEEFFALILIAFLIRLIGLWVSQNSPRSQLYGRNAWMILWSIFFLLMVTNEGRVDGKTFFLVLQALLMAVVCGAFVRLLGPVAEIAHRKFVEEPNRRREERQRQKDASELDSKRREIEAESRLRAEEYERRMRPIREKEARERELQRQATANQQQELKKKKDEVHFRCEMAYDRMAPEIGDTFTRDQLHSYLTRYLSVDVPADELDQRADALIEMLEGFRNGGLARGKSVDEHYDAELERINGLDISEEAKEAMRSEIYFARDRAVRTGKVV